MVIRHTGVYHLNLSVIILSYSSWCNPWPDLLWLIHREWSHCTCSSGWSWNSSCYWGDFAECWKSSLCIWQWQFRWEVMQLLLCDNHLSLGMHLVNVCICSQIRASSCGWICRPWRSFRKTDHGNLWSVLFGIDLKLRIHICICFKLLDIKTYQTFPPSVSSVHSETSFTADAFIKSPKCVHLKTACIGGEFVLGSPLALLY